MERVFVVVGVGCTPLVMVFTNQEAVLEAKEVFEKQYDRVYTYELDVLEGFSKYNCPYCGGDTYVLRWCQPMEARISVDSGHFSQKRMSNLDDPRDVEIVCYDCDRDVSSTHGGDLEDRLWEHVY